MIADLKPYPEYKESGLLWLGEIPAHWQLRRFKYLLREREARSATGKEQLLRVSQYTGVTQRNRADGLEEPDTRADSLVGYKVVEPDELVVNIMLAWNGSLGVSRHHGIASPAYCVYRVGLDAHPWYVHELLRSPIYKARIKAVSTGVVESRLRLYTDDLYRLESLLPPADEQAVIVRFLEHTNAKIERAIRAKRKLITLLNEQKQGIIHRAVSHGLDPSVRLKPSGIPWLGEVPEQWVTVSLRQRYHQCLGKMVDAKKVTGKHLIPYLRNIDVRWGHINTTDLPLIDIAPHERERYTVKPGDLLVCEGRHLGRSAIWKGGIEVCGFQKALHRLRPISREVDDPRFLQYVLVVANATDAFHRNKIDNAIPHLTGEMLRAHRFAFPPIHEQRKIATYLESHLQQHERAIARAEREIALLREYRTTLTSAVVTGKLDVREAVKNLPTSAVQPTAPDGADVPDDTDDELTEFAE